MLFSIPQFISNRIVMPLLLEVCLFNENVYSFELIADRMETICIENVNVYTFALIVFINQ